MAIKTDYNFKGIEVKDATIKIIRIFGSSKEGWNSLVGVFTQTVKEIPAVEAIEQVGEVGDENYVAPVAAIEAQTIVTDNLIEELNFSAPFKEDERGYTTLYLGLTEKFGGIEI